jgi:hypothetical protein
MIEDRDYKKQELADLLYPDTENPKSRQKALWREVTGCPELVEALKKLRWNRHKQTYTKQQIIKIKEILCRD